MDPKIVQQTRMYFVGIEKVYTESNFDPGYQNIWFNEFMPRKHEIESLAIDKAHYALEKRNTEIKDSHTYMVALKIANPATVPDGFIIHESPAGLFAQFATTPADMGIMIPGWFNTNNKYEERFDAYRIEYYPPESANGQSAIYMWIPIELKK